MNKSLLIRSTTLASALLLQLSALCFHAHGAAGDVDLAFDPGSGVNGPVLAIALQPDGKPIIGGAFTMVKGLIRPLIARLNADGSGDGSFVYAGPNSGIGTVSDIVLQPDGKALVGHILGISRLNSDGTLDATFISPTITDDNFLTKGVDALALQADGKILIGGTFTIVEDTFRNGIARLNADGSLDTTFDPGVGVQDFFPALSSIAVQADGKILIGGTFVGYDFTSRNNIARINADGSLDATFDPGTGTDGSVRVIALQPDGKAIIGGSFGNINGTNRGNVARLNSDGSVDSGFSCDTGMHGAVFTTALQADGKVLIGGVFTVVNGTNRDRIARLNADGGLDPAFDPASPSPRDRVVALALQTNGKALVSVEGSDNSTRYNLLVRLNTEGAGDDTFRAGGGIEGAVRSLVLQPDGKALIAGTFSFINGARRAGTGRLNANGTLDSSFNPDPLADGEFFLVALQPDGKVLVGGYSTFVDGVNTYHGGIARLNADGSLDGGFNAGTGVDGGTVRSIALQPDGKVLIGGGFETVNGTSRNSLARLNSDGSLDGTFNPDLAGGDVFCIAVQSDGKVLIGGSFTVTSGVNRDAIARLNIDGSLDSSFERRVESFGGGYFDVTSIVLQPDGKVLIAGNFSRVQGMSRTAIARLNTNGSLDGSFDAGSDFINGPAVRNAGAITLQADGRMLVGGTYYLGNEEYLQGLYRLNANGSIDTTLNPGVNPSVGASAIALSPDSKILIGGNFLEFNGAVRPFMARLYGDSQPPASFAIWAASFALSGADAAADTDPDDDGLANGLEYILGSNPTISSNNIRPVVSLIGANMEVTFPRLDLSETPDLTLTVEASTDLLTWSAVFTIGATTAASSPGVSILENGAAADFITVSLALDSHPRLFARLKVIVTP